jgi:hypothetical protein
LSQTITCSYLKICSTVKNPTYITYVPRLTEENKVHHYVSQPNQIPEEHNDLCTLVRLENEEHKLPRPVFLHLSQEKKVLLPCSRNKWACFLPRAEFEISATLSLQAGVLISLGSLSKQFVVHHTLSDEHHVPSPSFSFLTPYPLFSPLCSQAQRA